MSWSRYSSNFDAAPGIVAAGTGGGTPWGIESSIWLDWASPVYVYTLARFTVHYAYISIAGYIVSFET